MDVGWFLATKLNSNEKLADLLIGFFVRLVV
jgi:hypothetical protein